MEQLQRSIRYLLVVTTVMTIAALVHMAFTSSINDRVDKLEQANKASASMENLQRANVRAVISFENPGKSSVLKDDGVRITFPESFSGDNWMVITWEWDADVKPLAYLDNFREDTNTFEWHTFKSDGSCNLKLDKLTGRTIVLLGIRGASTVQLPF